MKTELKKLPKSEVEIDFELSREEFNKYVDRALEHLKSHVKMDGFRKGKVPTNIVEQKIGNENLLMEAGDLAVKESYTKYVSENNLEPIGNPDMQIKKIAKGSDFLFTVKVTVLPEIQLPNYKEIAFQLRSGQANNISVNEKEIEDTLQYLQKSRAKFITENRPAQNKDFVEIEYQNKDINSGKTIKDRFILGEGGFLKDFEDNIIGMKAGEEKEFTSKFPENNPRKDLAGKDAHFKVKVLSVQKMELPEINDEFAKNLGAFDNLAALKSNLNEGITIEKQETEKQRRRQEILEKITAEIKFDLPEKLIESEQLRLFEDLQKHIKVQFNVPFEEYLASIQKTEDEIKKSYRLEAEKRIKNFLVLRQIGKAENIEVSNEELEQEMNKELRKHTKAEVDKIDIQQLKEYSKNIIYNEKVFQKLEIFSK